MNPRVVRFGSVQREIGILPGEFRGASFSIDLDNTDNWFSAIKAAEVLRRRTVELWLGETRQGNGGLQIVCRGSDTELER